MTPPPSKSADLHETVVHSFDGVVKDGGEAQSQSASDASSMSAAVDKKPDSNTWILISALLVLSTLLQSLKPSEPYIPDFWRKTKGLTPDEFNTSPAYRSYAMTIMLPIVSYSSEYLIGYVPAIVFGLLCRWLCQFTFYFTNSLTWLKASFAIFGLSHSTKTIYSAFTYSMVPVHAFHRITAYIRSANFVAHVLGGSIGNLIDRHMEQNPYFFMFLLSQICVGLGVIAFVAAIGLNYVYKVGSKDALANIKPPTPKSFREAKELFQSLYHSVDVRIWSTFFIFSYAAVDVIWDYQPILFGEVERKLDVHSYKGFVMAGTRLGCATASIIAGRSRTVYAKWHLVIMTLSGGIIGLCFVLNYFFQHYIHALYVLFFILMVVNEFCVCGITAQIAVKTQQSMRGMVLLLNMTVAMLFQSGLQFTFNRLGFGLLTRYVVLALCLFLFSGGMLLYMFGQLLLVYVRNVISPIRRQRNNNAPRI